MKRIVLFITFLCIGLCANANQNYLHTVNIEGAADGYNITLYTDLVPKITKQIKGSDNIVLDVKGIKTADTINAVYKNTDDVNGLVIENVADDEIKLYIQAKNIAISTILAQLPDQTSVIINEHFPVEKIVWSFAVFLILVVLVKSAKSITDYENSILIKKDIKDREVELYRNFQKELASMPKINSKINNAYATNAMQRTRRNYKELARM